MRLTNSIVFRSKSFLKNLKWGNKTFFFKILVFRGIGYRATYIVNKLQNKASGLFKYKRYLLIRAGHTIELVLPMAETVFAKVKKKERKLILYGENKQLINFFASSVLKYRKPSLYTGRGIREKHIKVIRKIRKDKQKQKKGKKF